MNICTARRYDAALRNPYNEIECSDHYARAMASYGAFISASGYEYHGPKGHIGFAPRLSPENFKAPFTSAQGWGTFTQQITATCQKESINIKWGTLKINTMSFEVPAGKRIGEVKVYCGARNIKSEVKNNDGRLTIVLDKSVTVEMDGLLTVDIDIDIK